jgi:transposase
MDQRGLRCRSEQGYIKPHSLPCHRNYLNDGQVPIDNNWIENRIRPIATGRKNWLFAGSLRAGKRAAVIMILIQSAKLNGHDPLLYLKDILSRLPTRPNSRISELLPHRWLPEISA